MSTAYFIVPRGAGGAEIILDDFNAAKRRADKLDALVRENGLKGRVLHGAGGRVSVAPPTPEQRAETARVVEEMRAEWLAGQAERDADAAAYDRRMWRLSNKKED